MRTRSAAVEEAAPTTVKDGKVGEAGVARNHLKQAGLAGDPGMPSRPACRPCLPYGPARPPRSPARSPRPAHPPPTPSLPRRRPTGTPWSPALSSSSTTSRTSPLRSSCARRSASMTSRCPRGPACPCQKQTCLPAKGASLAIRLQPGPWEPAQPCNACHGGRPDASRHGRWPLGVLAHMVLSRNILVPGHLDIGRRCCGATPRPCAPQPECPRVWGLGGACGVWGRAPSRPCAAAAV